MAGTDTEQVGEGRLDLVPMIDCIMLLLLFFMMTVRFTAEDKVIAQLLPVDQGPSARSAPVQDPPRPVVVRIVPAGIERGGQPSDYGRALAAIRARDGAVIQRAVIRVGNRPETVELDVSELVRPAGEPLSASLEKVHTLVAAALADYDRAGLPRDRQEPVSIQCFSGLSWQFPAVAYDAVRAYEATRAGRGITARTDLDHARSISWSQPRLRDFTLEEAGNELFEIVHAR
ncbi:MAG: Biopolymer transport protein ExbD/TolR [Planctomycetota bacterium]|jgi:biopolymer transport protein ExbD